MRTSVSCRFGDVLGVQAPLTAHQSWVEKVTLQKESFLCKVCKNMQRYAGKKSSASPLMCNVQAASHDSSHPPTLVFSASFSLCVTGDPWMTGGVS